MKALTHCMVSEKSDRIQASPTRPCAHALYPAVRPGTATLEEQIRC
jgi:hypothetical protein